MIKKLMLQKKRTESRVPLESVKLLFAALLFFIFCPAAVHAAPNFLGNSGFEAAIGNGNDARNWDSTNGAVRVTNATRPAGFSVGPAGTNALQVEAGNFTFQLSSNVQPGDTVTFSGRAESNIPAGFGGGQLKIEFKTAADVFISSTSSVAISTGTAPSGGGYVTFTVGPVVAPVNAGKVVFVMDAPDFTGPPAGTRFVVYDQMNVDLQTAAAAVGPNGGTGVDTSNVIKNPGIENPIGGAENWDSTNGAVQADAAALAAAGFAAAPEGSKAMILNDGTFTFQTYGNVHEGDQVTFSGFAQSSIFGLANGGRLKIEFRNISGNDNQLLDTAFSSLMNSATAPGDPANPYVYFEAKGAVPVGANSAVFVVETVGGVGGQIAVDQFHATVNPVTFSIAASSGRVQPGGFLTVNAQYRNTSTVELSGVEFVADFPKGFDVVGRSVTKDGHRSDFREGSIIVPVGTLAGSDSVSISFVLVATSNVAVGKAYSLKIIFRDSTGQLISRSVQVVVENDPVFAESTIIGKVFNDLNQNGQQDGCVFVGTEENCSASEKGVPFVRLVTEEGIIVITDEHGRYHLPNIKEGRHLVKIDGHTLPDGTQFTTEESYLVHARPGLMSKVNFGVLIPPSEIPKQFEQDLMVSVTQGLDTSRPDLEVLMTPDVLRSGIKRFEKDPVFSFRMNYPEMIKNWFLEIRDQMGRPIWTGFGLGAPPAEVVWSGQMENGNFINPGVYSYQMKVEDQKGYQDWTPLHFFRVMSKTHPYNPNQMTEIPPVGDFNIFKDGKRTIPLVAKPTLQIQGKTKKGNTIKINSYPVSVDEDGIFQTQIYTTPGDKEINITATTPDGENVAVTKKVKVKDSTFFMVALADGEGGINFNRGNVETVGRAQRFKEGFYEDGRMSYYLRGKLKGKFLVKSHYDTGDKRSALFTNLDQDQYYPIYGDNSVRDYEANDTLERFYMIVEMDRSFAKFGSFQTAFTDTELATYNRTLSGLKVHHETLSTTVYGDPKRGFKLFAAKTSHRADHNEFLATGGSLYYLRNRRVLEGSEKIRIEVHDRIQDIAIESVDLQEGIDYEIDYPEGRIILTKPLSSISASDTLVSHDILDGNPVYLIVDYEFDAGTDAFEDKNRGLRGYTHIGDHIRVGATAVEEKRQSDDYDLRGVDMQLRMGRNTKVTTEYAETKLQQTQVGLSSNGGLSFADLKPINSPAQKHPRENAYLIKAESKPVDNLDTSGYLQGVDPGFSTDHIRSQEGFRKYGVAARYKFTEDFYMRYRYDMANTQNELNPPSAYGILIPYERRKVSTVQAVFDNDQWLAEAEYRHQFSDIPRDVLIPTLLSEIPFEDGIAAKLGYHLNDRLLPYVKAQAGFTGKPNNQFGGGVRYQINSSLFGYIEQMIGNIGDSTRFGFEKYHGTSRSYAGLKMLDFGDGIKNFATSIGSSRSLSERSRVYSEREYSSYGGQDGYANILGYDKQINEQWSFEAKGERRYLDQSSTRLLDQTAAQSIGRTNAFNTISGGVGYRNGKKMQARTSLEFRYDNDVPDLSQWLTRNQMEYHLTQDLSFLGKLNYGKSRFLEPGNTAAAFTELSTGFAFRPVDNDKLNVLTRYTLLRNIANDFQFQNALFNGVQTDQTDHIVAIDLAYDLYKYLGMVDKLAYKHTTLRPNVTEEVIVKQILAAHRFNFHITRKWDVGLEYRALWQLDAAKTLKHGALTEVDRELYDYVRLGLGYNFTDFDDDLRKVNNFSSHGPFVRMTGKF